jgi:hypothetical protein
VGKVLSWPGRKADPYKRVNEILGEIAEVHKSIAGIVAKGGGIPPELADAVDALIKAAADEEARVATERLAATAPFLSPAAVEAVARAVEASSNAAERDALLKTVESVAAVCRAAVRTDEPKLEPA